MNQGLFFLMLIAAVGFSLNPIIAKSLSHELSYSAFLIFRYGFVVLFLPIIAIIMSEVDFKSFTSISKKGFMEFFVLSFFFAGNTLLFYFAFNYITINRAFFLFFTYPVFTIIFARLILKEKASSEEIVAVFITIFGAAAIFWNGDFSRTTIIGDLMIMTAAIMWAAYIVLNRYTALREVHYRQTFWVFLFSIVWTLPFFYFFDYTAVTSLSVTAIYALLAFGFISTLLPYAIMNYSAKHMRSTVVGLFVLLSMIITIFISIVFLGEEATPNVILGGVLIVIASFISVMSFKSVFLLNHKIKSQIQQSAFLSIVKKIIKKKDFENK